jgi:hypothetical protein
MSKILFLEPYWSGNGITDELFSIVYGILNCINNHKSNLILSNFKLEVNKEIFCEINDILDIHYLNILLNKYNITVFEKNKLIFNIESVCYGINESILDIKNEIMELYYKNNKLYIPSGIKLNDIKGDPMSGVIKELYINYTLNNKLIKEKYGEYINSEITIDLQNPIIIKDLEEIYDYFSINKKQFEYLLKNIKFNSRLVKYSKTALLIDKNNKYTTIDAINFENKKINMLYLIDEKYIMKDILKHNKLSKKDFDEYLSNKYIELITQYFSKNDIIFIISYNLNDKIITFLTEYGYEFYCTKKNIFYEKEKHDIIDLLISEKCNNYFIGNLSPDIRNCSLMSYLLYIRNNASENIFIDMYNITDIIKM